MEVYILNVSPQTYYSVQNLSDHLEFITERLALISYSTGFYCNLHIDTK